MLAQEQQVTGIIGILDVVLLLGSGILCIYIIELSGLAEKWEARTKDIIVLLALVIIGGLLGVVVDLLTVVGGIDSTDDLFAIFLAAAVLTVVMWFIKHPKPDLPAPPAPEPPATTKGKKS